MIKFEDFSFKYEGAKDWSIKNIDLEILDGECILLTGLSGCGKSTLLRIINGISPSVFGGDARGDFSIENITWDKSNAAENSQYVGSVLQDSKAGFLFREAEDECKFGAQCLNRSKDDIESDFAKFSSSNANIFEIQDVLYLSSGESQILSIISQKLKKPKIIVMDEPSANLDLNEIENLRQNILELKKSNITIIIAEHRISYFEDLCNRKIYMEAGGIVDDIDLELRDINRISFKKKAAIKNSASKLDLLSLNYKTKDKIIFNNANCTIDSGLVTAIVGANGSGKSTLGKILCGLLNAKRLIAIDNKILDKRELILNSYLCMQEGYKQMVSASVREEILLQNSALTETEIKEFLKTVDLVDYIDRHPSRLSGGQVQRLAVLLAYISDKRIIVLDEPSSGLDLIHMRNVSELIRKMAKKGKFVLLISHDIELLASTADAFIYIENEKLSETQNLYSKCDFDLMTKHMKSKTERKISKKSQKLKPPNINPIVNILVFFAMANAIFLYPATKSSIYLMLILSFVLILNFNFYICIKAWIAYGILNLLKFYAPMYFKVVFEVFLIRGFMTNYALKNIIEKTETIYIIEALYRAKITDYLMIPLISILRLFPTLRHDSSICFMSLKTRNLTYKKSPRKIWNLIIVPLVFSLIRSAENLACGIETKGMKINQKRSCMSDIKFRIRDFAILIIFFANYIYIFIGG